MRRRKTTYLAPSQNLDSFLDILANTVGVLMFIGLFASLLAIESEKIIRTPLVSETRKLPYLLEVRNNQIIDLEASIEAIAPQRQQLLANLAQCDRPQAPESNETYLLEDYLQRVEVFERCQQQQRQRLANFSTTTEHYAVTYNGENIIYQPLPGVAGESMRAMGEGNSRYRQILEDLDPNRDYLAFIVRPDSFSAFRQARQIARSQGFEVGWEPYPAGEDIPIGGGGRSIGVQ